MENQNNIKKKSIPVTPLQRWSNWDIVKKILLLGLPLIVGEFGSICQQFADTMMVGNYGTEELAAAGFVNSIFYFIIFLMLGISYASTPVIGNAFGRKDDTGVFKAFRDSIVVNLSVAIFFVLLLVIALYNLEYLFFNPNFELFHQPYGIFELSKKYIIPLTFSIPFLGIFYACKQYLDAIGDTKASMWIMLVSNIINIILNYCLIWGKFGFPELGLLGAGVSTLISRILQVVFVLFVIYKTDIFKKIRRSGELQKTAATLQGIKEQFRLGFPVSIQLGLEIGTFNMCGIFMGWLGTIPLAAHQSMYTISTLCFQILYGIGAAGTILISQFHGAGEYQNIRRTGNLTFFVGLVSVSVIIAMICLFFNPLAHWFTNDNDVIRTMYFILPWLVFYQLGDCTQITFANALRGIERTLPLMYIAIFAYIIVCIPLCYVLAFPVGAGVHGVWAGIPLGLSIAGLLFGITFRKYTKK